MGATTRQAWGPWIVFAAVCLGALTLVLLAPPSAAPYYRRYVGNVDPTVAILLAAIVGAVCLGALRALAGFAIVRRERLARGVLTAVVLATVFGGAVIVADLLLRYPLDLNAPLPAALAFYPSIGLVAEVAFHLVPLTAALVLLLPLRGWLGARRQVWIAIVLVALIEPVFQVAAAGGALTRLDAYTAAHVFAFALAQLYLFRRYDFASMFALRLAYYLYWHIAWGWLRLSILG